MKVKDFDRGYAIIKYNYWLKYKQNSFVERYSHDLNEAKFIKDSLERCDRIPFVVINCETQEIESY